MFNNQLKEELETARKEAEEWEEAAKEAVEEQNYAADLANTYRQAILDGTARAIPVRYVKGRVKRVEL